MPSPAASQSHDGAPPFDDASTTSGDDDASDVDCAMMPTEIIVLRARGVGEPGVTEPGFAAAPKTAAACVAVPSWGDRGSPDVASVGGPPEAETSTGVSAGGGVSPGASVAVAAAVCDGAAVVDGIGVGVAPTPGC